MAQKSLKFNTFLFNPASLL